MVAGDISVLEGILTAAEGRLAELAALEEGDELLERAFSVLEEDPTSAAELERLAREREREARGSMARGMAGASRAGLAPDWPPREGVALLLEAARELISKIQSVADLDLTGQEALRTEIRRLDERLGRLQGLLEK